MAKRKNKTGLIILSIIGIVVLLLALNWFGVFDKLHTDSITLSTIPINTACTFPDIMKSTCEETATNVIPFICPNNKNGQTVNACQLIGMLECSNGGQEPTVSFRTNVQNSNWNLNGIDSYPPWISNIISSSLVPYTFVNKVLLDTPLNQFPGITKQNLHSSVSYSGGLDGSSDMYIQSGTIYITKGETGTITIPPISPAHLCAHVPCSCGGGCMDGSGYTASDGNCGQTVYNNHLSQDSDCGALYQSSTKPGQYYYQFNQDTTKSYINTSITQAEPFHSHGLEIGQGSQNTYNCQGNFEVVGLDGVIRYGPSLSTGVDKTKAWNKTDSSQSLLPGEKAYFDYLGGGGIGHVFVSYEKDVEGCASGNKPVCIPKVNGISSGYWNCVGGNLDKSRVIPCTTPGTVCDDTVGNCTFPITQTIQFSTAMSGGTIKTFFGQNDLVYLQNRLISSNSQINKADVTFFVCPSGSDVNANCPNFYYHDYDLTGLTNPPVPTIPASGPGTLDKTYKVITQVTYNGNTVTLPGDFSFTITSPLTCVVNLVSGIGSGSLNRLYKGFPIILSITGYQDNQAVTVDQKQAVVTLSKTGSSSNLFFPDSYFVLDPSGKTEAYKYSFIVNDTVQVDATANVKIGQSSVNCSLSASGHVQPIDASTSFTGIDIYTCDKCCVPINKTVRLHIQSVDGFGGFIDTSNVITVGLPNNAIYQPISDTLHPEGTGKYYFDYNFDSSGGHTFHIVSNSDIYGPISTVDSGSIVALDNCNVVQCQSDSDCSDKGSNYVCNNGNCEIPNPINWILYISIGIGVLVGIIILVIVIKVVKKPRQNINTGFDGGITGL